MRSFLIAAALSVLSIPMIGGAQSAFNGTWKLDLNKSSFSPKPDVYILADGMYECKTCVPAYKIKADGTDQSVTGHPYFDSVAIKVVSDHEIAETDKKNGNTVATSTTTISADGKHATFSFSDSSNTNGGPPVTGSGTAVLVAPGPAGSHAVSGSWKLEKIGDMSDNAIIWTYNISADQITMTSKSGQSYTAKLDGTDAPMVGDPGTTSVSVTMAGKNTLVETDKRDGKVISVWKMTVEVGGKTATAINEDKLTNRTAHFVVIKQ
jgi:hypothetical protein